MKQIKLTLGKVALVDDEDYDFLNQWKWTAQRVKRIHGEDRFYANRQCRGKCLAMHRVIMERYMVISDHVDHEDGDGLNNQKYNIRKCTRSQNGVNRDGWGELRIKGVTIDRSNGYLYYRARIMVNKKSISLGNFADIKSAAVSYNEAAKLYFGEFAKLNQI